MLTKIQFILTKWKYGAQCLENNILYTLGLNYRQPPIDFSYTPVNESSNQFNQSHSSLSLKDIFDTSILWAVPKKRRTLERRMKRKFGHPDDIWKLEVPRKDLVICYTCGHKHQKKHLCANCYVKVKEETTKLQDKIIAALGLNPVEKEVVVLYKGEKDDASQDFHKTHHIVEVESERPPWFSKNLLQKTTQKESDSTDVKPTELG